MTKFLSLLTLLAFAAGAQAASHAGAAPMKGDAAKPAASAASGAKKADKKPMKSEMKKEDAKK